MSEPRLEHHAIKIRQLIDDYRGGRIVIPEFQRDYVWKRGRAPRLIDSLYRGFPISSLLLWIGTEETRARRRDPRPTRAGMISWLIDGQQRVITLARCMSGDEGIDVVFHPDEEEFRSANAATNQDPAWFRLAEIWDDGLYLNLRRNLPPGPKGEAREMRFERVRRMLDYEVPAVRMVDHDFHHAVDAFTRINTLGVKLKKEDIESAQIAARHTGFVADEVGPFLKQKHQQGFSRLNVMHLFRACEFVARPDGRKRTPLHELDRREVLAAWNRTTRATDEAIGLVRSELGLVNMEILWSGALLVPLIALCATTIPRERDARGMIGWLSIATLLHRYSKASETALDQDLRACRADDPIGALLTTVRREEGDFAAVPEDFSGSLVDRSGLLAAYIACHHRGLKDLFSGAKILLQGNVDRHHILPRAHFAERQRPKADCIANIAFVTGGANRAVGANAPEVYLPKLDPGVLATQCIPADPKLWRIERAKDFWAARKDLLAQAFNEHLCSTLPNRRVQGARPE